MLNPIIERMLWVLIAAIALVAGIAFERHEGAQSCIARDTAAEEQLAVQVATESAAAKAEVQKEMEDYARAISQPVTTAPVVRVCASAEPSSAGKVLRPAAPAARAAPGPGVPAKPAPDPGTGSAGSDIGEPVEAVGRLADAQVAGLVDYIKSVCLKPQAH